METITIKTVCCAQCGSVSITPYDVCLPCNSQNTRDVTDKIFGVYTVHYDMDQLLDFYNDYMILYYMFQDETYKTTADKVIDLLGA